MYSLPILAKSVVPKITTTTPSLDLKRCFLGYPYKKVIKLNNDSGFGARYEVLNPVEEEPGFVCSTEAPVGVIDPHSTLEIQMEFVAKKVGMQSSTVSLAIQHYTEEPLKIAVKGIVDGPVIFVDPVSLDWGTVPVLTSVSKTVTVSNQSLIPALIGGVMVRLSHA